MKKEIIEALMSVGKIQFQYLRSDLREAAAEIGRKEFDILFDGRWQDQKLATDNIFDGKFAYRLRPDYEQLDCELCGDTKLIPTISPHDKSYYGDKMPCHACQPEPSIVECEIRIGKQAHCESFLVYVKPNGDEVLLSESIDQPGFIGFKFEDGHVRATPIYYGGKFSNFYPFIKPEDLKTDSYTVLHATHVLFRKI
jgi:hypothetical protein